MAKEFGIEVSDRHINRLLKDMGLSTRQKRQKDAPEITNSTKDSSIRIGDLPASSSPNFQWSPNFIKLSS